VRALRHLAGNGAASLRARAGAARLGSARHRWRCVAGGSQVPGRRAPGVTRCGVWLCVAVHWLKATFVLVCCIERKHSKAALQCQTAAATRRQCLTLPSQAGQRGSGLGSAGQ